MSTPGPGQPGSINSLLRRWLAVRGSKLAAARVADRVAPYFDRGDFGEHLPLLGSAALLQLARDTAKPVVTFGSETGGFLLLLVHGVGSQHAGRPRVGASQQRARRDACVLYMRRDVVAACDAFNARVQPPLFQQAAAACKIEIDADSNIDGSPDCSGNDNTVSLHATPSRLKVYLSSYMDGNGIGGNLVRWHARADSRPKRTVAHHA